MENSMEMSSLQIDMKACETQFVCYLCLKLACLPVQCPHCEKILCKQCIDSWLQSHIICPGCNTVLGYYKELNSTLQKSFENLKVFCPNRLKGCKEFVYHAVLDFHLKNRCMFEPLPCPNKDRGCKEKVTRESIPTHLKDGCKFEAFCEPNKQGIKKTELHTTCIKTMRNELNGLRRKVARKENEVKETKLKEEKLQKLSEAELVKNSEEKQKKIEDETDSFEEVKEASFEFEKIQLEEIKDALLTAANPFEKKEDSEKDEEISIEIISKKKHTVEIKRPRFSNFPGFVRTLTPEVYTLVTCQLCHRQFREAAVVRHQEFCKKAHQKKREVFDSKKQRLLK